MNGRPSSTSPEKQTSASNPFLGALLLTLAGILFITSLLLLASAAHANVFTPPEQASVYFYKEYMEEPEPITEETLAILERNALHAYYDNIVGDPTIVEAVIRHAEELGAKDVDILFALMWKESRFIPTAVGRNRTSRDYGLFQLNSSVYHQYTEDEFFCIEWNIETGIRHFQTELYAMDNDYRLALHAYNAGRSRAHNPPSSTKRYASQILDQYQLWALQRMEFEEDYIRNETLTTQVSMNK